MKNKAVSFATKTFMLHLPAELDDRIEKICRLTGSKKHFLIMRAVEEGLDRIEQRLAQLWAENNSGGRNDEKESSGNSLSVH
ncbi:MAG: hypothetical protein QXG09_07965 [Candidatus Bathyarchaeia archaeon]